jgi:hypothetical protein
LGGRAQLCLIGEEQAVVEELREVAEHQLAVRPSGILGTAAQKILNRL